MPTKILAGGLYSSSLYTGIVSTIKILFFSLHILYHMWSTVGVSPSLYTRSVSTIKTIFSFHILYHMCSSVGVTPSVYLGIVSTIKTIFFFLFTSFITCGVQ